MLEDTFYQSLSITLDQPIGSMSISPSNRDLALGARKGIYVLDLDNPYDPPRLLENDSTWERADIQWNPHPHRAEWVVSTSNQKALVFNLLLSLSPSSSSSTPASSVEHTLHAHTRAITDINWSGVHPEILATCGLDGWVWAWDLRSGWGGKGGRAWGVCDWGNGATQVKWNRLKPNVVASSHGNRVLIWDDRMTSKPVTTIDAHSAKIYGIDWSRRSPEHLVTCSLDRTFKEWCLATPSMPTHSFLTPTPIARARHLPFGSGILTLPQRGDFGVSIWSRERIEKGTGRASYRFEGGREGVREFVWRVKGGEDESVDDREFQLITWSRDNRLRLWPISDEILRECGHVKGAPIDVAVPRRGAKKVSYRTYVDFMPSVIPPSPVVGVPQVLSPGPILSPPFPPSTNPFAPASPSQRVTSPSLLTSSLMQSFVPSSPSKLASSPAALLPARPMASPSSPSLLQQTQPLGRPNLGQSSPLLGNPSSLSRRKPLMPLSSAGLGLPGVSPNRSRQATMKAVPVPVRRAKGKMKDRLAWMEGVTLIRQDKEAVDEEGEAKGAKERSRSRIRMGTGGTTTTGAGPSTASSVIEGESSRDTTVVPHDFDVRASTQTVRGGSEQGKTASRPATVTGHTGPAVKEKDSYANLGEEVTAVVKKFAGVNFEKIHVAGRTCTISMYSPIFLRATFNFPRNYPLQAPLMVEIERHADIPSHKRAHLLQGVRKVVQARTDASLPSLEQAIRFLLGQKAPSWKKKGGKGRQEGKALYDNDSGGSSSESDDSDEFDEDDIQFGPVADSAVLRAAGAEEKTSEVWANNQRLNVPPPRRSGAVFGPHGFLFVFFPTVSAQPDAGGTKGQAASPLQTVEEKATQPVEQLPPLSETFGVLSHTDRPKAAMSTGYVESDEALQVSTSLYQRSATLDFAEAAAMERDYTGALSFSSKIHVKDARHLIGVSSQPPDYAIGGSASERALSNAALAKLVPDPLAERIWSTLALFFADGASDKQAEAIESVLAQRVFQEMLAYLQHVRDIKTLGLIACMFEQFRRARSAKEGQASTKGTLSGEETPMDYFSHRKRRIDPISEQSSGTHTPMPRTHNSYSPKPSWANLAGFFKGMHTSLTPPSPRLASPRQVTRVASSVRSLSPNDNSPSTKGPAAHSPLAETRTAGIPMEVQGPSSLNESRSANSNTSASLTSAASDPRPPASRKPKRVVIIKRHRTQKSPPAWWLAPAFQLELECYRLAYAELLFRWQRFLDRVEVLKLCGTAPGAAALLKTFAGLDPSSGLELQPLCSRCRIGTTASSGACDRCDDKGELVTCCLCHLPVQGLTLACMLCFHTGHADCLAPWFKDQSHCPSGCLCSCEHDGGLSGHFAQPPPRLTGSALYAVTPGASTPLITPRPGLHTAMSSYPFFKA